MTHRMPADERIWHLVREFFPVPSEIDKWGDPSRMDSRIVLALYDFRKHVDRPVFVHCGYEDRQDGGFHPLGMAVDVHVAGMPLADQLLEASRFESFTGIGAYPWWNRPGLHLDARPLAHGAPRALWGSTGPKQYVACDGGFLARCV